MNILNRHILKNLLYVFTASLLVLTFILVLGLMIKILSRMDSTVSQVFIFQMFLMLLPKILAYAIPIATLVSVTLVFSRMSAENEITAMRASGISLWQIVNPAIPTLHCMVAADVMRIIASPATGRNALTLLSLLKTSVLNG